jgi:hypothetical protein
MFADLVTLHSAALLNEFGESVCYSAFRPCMTELGFTIAMSLSVSWLICWQRRKGLMYCCWRLEQSWASRWTF